MATKQRLTTILGAATCALCVAAAQPGAAQDKSIKLSGCLVKAESGDGYLVTNAPNEPAMVGTSGSNVNPNAFGGSGNYTTVLYWVDDDDDLREHIGHRVEIEGDLKGDIKDGELTIEREDKWTELEIKSDGRTLKANVPHTSVAARDDDKDQKGRVMVRRVAAEKVKMLAASCTP